MATTSGFRGTTWLTWLCLISFLVTLVLLGISAASDHTGEIVFGYFAFLTFLFVSLPLHLVGIPVIVYTGARATNHGPLAWQYAYFAVWVAIHVVVFRSFLFQEIPQQVERALFTVTHQDEIELSRALQRHESDPARVRALIESGVDVNQVDRYIGFPPIVWAARQGDPEVVRMLIEAGADVSVVIDKPSNTGVLNELFIPEVTPLGFAAVTRNDAQRLAVVQEFLRLGVDPDRGHAVLGACAFGDVPALEALLAAGAKLDVEDLEGFTCSHAAAHSGRLDMLKYLLERGQAQDRANEHRRSPLDVALFRHQEGAVLLLLQHGSRPRSAESLERFLAQEPADTAIKATIREQFIDAPDPEIREE